MIIRKSAITLARLLPHRGPGRLRPRGGARRLRSRHAAPGSTLRKTHRRCRPGKTLIGILHVVASLPGERYTFKIAAAAKRPDCLRLEDLSVIGLPDFMLTVKGAEIRMFLPRSGEFLVGTESSEHDPAHLPARGETAGPRGAPLRATPRAYSSAKSLKGSVDGNRFRLDVYARGTWVQSLWVDPATGRLAKIEIADGHGNTAYRALFHDFVEMGSLTVPARIEIETEGMAKVRLSLRNTDMELVSRDDDPDFFLLKPPGHNPAGSPTKKGAQPRGRRPVVLSRLFGYLVCFVGNRFLLFSLPSFALPAPYTLYPVGLRPPYFFFNSESLALATRAWLVLRVFLDDLLVDDAWRSPCRRASGRPSPVSGARKGPCRPTG